MIPMKDGVGLQEMRQGPRQTMTRRRALRPTTYSAWQALDSPQLCLVASEGNSRFGSAFVRDCWCICCAWNRMKLEWAGASPTSLVAPTSICPTTSDRLAASSSGHHSFASSFRGLSHLCTSGSYSAGKNRGPRTFFCTLPVTVLGNSPSTTRSRVGILYPASRARRS